MSQYEGIEGQTLCPVHGWKQEQWHPFTKQPVCGECFGEAAEWMSDEFETTVRSWPDIPETVIRAVTRLHNHHTAAIRMELSNHSKKGESAQVSIQEAQERILARLEELDARVAKERAEHAQDMRDLYGDDEAIAVRDEQIAALKEQIAALKEQIAALKEQLHKYETCPSSPIALTTAVGMALSEKDAEAKARKEYSDLADDLESDIKAIREVLTEGESFEGEDTLEVANRIMHELGTANSRINRLKRALDE